MLQPQILRRKIMGSSSQKVSCRVLLALIGKGSAWIREWSAHAILIIRAMQ